MKSIVIIGSGLGGLICGYILSKEGFEVTILEKHHKFGGNLQTFKRDGVNFDTGMHYVGSLDKGQVLYKFFNYFDFLGKIKYRRLDEDGFDRIFIKDNEYSYAMGHSNYIHTASQYFPEHHKSIKAYINKIKEVVNNIDLYNLREVKSKKINDFSTYNEKVYDFITSLTSDIRLQNYFSALNYLYSGEKEKSLMYVHSLINNHYIESSYRFVDGSQQVADVFVENIKKNGGKVLKNKEVKEFIFNENKTLKAVKTKSGEQFYADYFISNMHPSNTMCLVPDDMIRKSYKKRLMRLPNTISPFTVYVVLKDKSIEYMNYNYCYYGIDDVWGVDNYSKTWPPFLGMYPLADSIDKKYTRGFSLMTYMDYNELKPWKNTSVENRGEDYKEFKMEKAQKVLDIIEKRFPGIKSKIKSFYTSSPLTLRDYTGSKNGSMYGIIRDYNNLNESFILPRTKISNLYLTGQNLNLHGMLGVSIGALLTCAEFTGLNYLIRKINKKHD